MNSDTSLNHSELREFGEIHLMAWRGTRGRIHTPYQYGVAVFNHQLP